MPGFVLVYGHAASSPRMVLPWTVASVCLKLYNTQCHLMLGAGSQRLMGNYQRYESPMCNYHGKDVICSHPRIHGHLVEDHDSHFDSACEYIVHTEAGIPPCYVIHLELGCDAAKAVIRDAQTSPFGCRNLSKKEKTHPRLHQEDLAPGDAKRVAGRGALPVCSGLSTVSGWQAVPISLLKRLEMFMTMKRNMDSGSRIVMGTRERRQTEVVSLVVRMMDLPACTMRSTTRMGTKLVSNGETLSISPRLRGGGQSKAQIEENIALRIL